MLGAVPGEASPRSINEPNYEGLQGLAQLLRKNLPRSWVNEAHCLATKIATSSRVRVSSNANREVTPLELTDGNTRAVFGDYMSVHFKPLLKKAKPPPFRFHDLRHTCATILLMAGKHPTYVQELLGHASIFITLDTYSHVIEGMDGGHAEAMDAAL